MARALRKISAVAVSWLGVRMSEAAKTTLGHMKAMFREAKSAPSTPDQPPVDPFLVGLYDMTLSGWYRIAEKELFLGFPISADDVVIDVGCGDGGNMEFCADIGAHVILADVDADQIGVAKA